MGIIHELEELHLIKVLKENLISDNVKISDKYRGVFSKEDAKSFNEYTENSRSEWKNI